MKDLLNALLLIGGLAAAGAVAAMCVVGLVVWVAGGKVGTRQ